MADWFLDGQLMPKELNIKLKTSPNDVDVRTLEGKLYTDFRDRNEEWEIGYGNIKKTDWDVLKAKYDLQYSTRQYRLFSYPRYNVEYLVKIDISDEPYFLGGVLVNSPSVTLKRQDPKIS